MWLLTVMIWYGNSGLQAFTKELPTEQLCNKVGASYHTMKSKDAHPDKYTYVQYQCIQIKQ